MLNYQIRIIFLMKSAFLIFVNNTWKWNEIWNLGNSLHPHKFWHIFTKVFNKLASTFHLLPGLLPFIYLTTQFLPKAGKMKTCCFHYLRCPILKPCLINGSGRCAKFIYTSPHLWKQIFEKEVERLSPTFAALISFVASQVLDLLHCRETQRRV